MNRYGRSFERDGKRYYRGESGKPIPLKSSASRYRSLAKDPATRSAVPSSYLSPAQRRQRELNARLDAPVGPGATATNRDVGRQATADAVMRYSGAEQQLVSQLGQSYMESRRIPGYMDAYRQQLQAAKAATQQAFAQAQQQMYSNAQQAGVGAAGVTDPGQQQIEAQAAAVRQQRASTLGDVAGVQGANSAAGFNHDIANVGLRLVEELAREAGRANEIRGKRQQLASEKGQYLVSRRQELGDAARKSGLENLVFASDQQQAAAKADESAARFREQKRSTRADDRRADAAQARQTAADKRAAEKDAYQREHQLGPYAPQKPSKSDEAKQLKESQKNADYRSSMTGNLADRIRIDTRKRRVNLKDPQQRREYVKYLRDTPSTRDWFRTPLGDVLVSGALDWAGYGRLSGVTVRRLREKGVVIAKDGTYGGPGAYES